MFNRRYIAFIVLFSISLLQGSKLNISKSEAEKIANRIWQNEGSSERRQLVWWNRGEEFASCGIGHFIWYTSHKQLWFKESFPSMIAFLIAHGAKPPRWLSPKTHCIWNSYEQWHRAKVKHTRRMRELTNFLDKTKGLQALFMLQRLNHSIPKILAYANEHGEGKIVKQNYQRLLYKRNGHIDSLGAYTLIDYLNFKGDGINKKERYQGKGWGLYQVLTRMNLNDSNPHHAFWVASHRVLSRLIKIAPPKRKIWRFKRGWFKRLDTYMK